ncbi:MAG: homoserine kinase [Acidobacteria bacterium]|nr:homoserine kinase [Acidobacteriota bacterium]
MSLARRRSSRRVKIRVPASTSNLGPAFDAVGLAFQLYLTVDAEELEQGPSTVAYSGEDPQLVPKDESNFMWRAMEEMAAEHGFRLPAIALRIANEIPITKGLGSSAAALLGAAAAVGFFCVGGWTREKLLELVSAREGHPDNVAPSLWGGLVASIGGVNGAGKVLCSKSEFPEEWTAIAVTPDFEIKTDFARSILPPQISRDDAVYNIQRVAFLMAQLVQGRREGLREAMADLLHQPYRAELLPGLKEVLEMEDCEGLLGIALSGAGSTVIAFADSHQMEIGTRICRIFDLHGITSRIRFLKADNTGLVVEPQP